MQLLQRFTPAKRVDYAVSISNQAIRIPPQQCSSPDLFAHPPRLSFRLNEW